MKKMEILKIIEPVLNIASSSKTTLEQDVRKNIGQKR